MYPINEINISSDCRTERKVFKNAKPLSHFCNWIFSSIRRNGMAYWVSVFGVCVCRLPCSKVPKFTTILPCCTFTLLFQCNLVTIHRHIIEYNVSVCLYTLCESVLYMDHDSHSFLPMTRFWMDVKCFRRKVFIYSIILLFLCTVSKNVGISSLTLHNKLAQIRFLLHWVFVQIIPMSAAVILDVHWDLKSLPDCLFAWRMSHKLFERSYSNFRISKCTPKHQNILSCFLKISFWSGTFQSKLIIF